MRKVSFVMFVFLVHSMLWAGCVGEQHVSNKTKSVGGPPTPGSSPPTWPPSTHVTNYTFTPDTGFRLDCASIPRIGQRPSGTYVLFASKSGASGLHSATSSDALTFSSLASTTSRGGHPDRLKLSSLATTLSGVYWRIYHHNAAFTNMGDGILNNASTQLFGTNFTATGVTNYTSPTGGNVGVMTSFMKGNTPYILTMDGLTSSANHHVYLLKASNIHGTSFSIEDSDPFGDDGQTSLDDIEVDPFVYKLSDASHWLLTMKAGNIRTWVIPPGLPNSFTFVQEVLMPGNFSTIVGKTIYSLHDPSIIQLADGSFRIFVAASHTDTDDCDGDGDTTEITYSIVSATSN